jgi:regulator of protease activity HflC (stomatin/prohibitin superfamily)
MMIRRKIKSDEIGLVFKDGQFEKFVCAGTHWFLNLFGKVFVERVSMRTPIFVHPKLRDIVKSNALKGIGDVLDLRDWQRALIWIDGRFFRVLPPGLYVIWTELTDNRIEVIDARTVRLDHEELAVISRAAEGDQLNVVTVDRDHAGVLFVDGRYQATLQPGRYAFWRKIAEVLVVQIDLREQAIDVNGQDLMTADKVTLRLNAIVTYRVVDAKLAVSSIDNVHQAIYRAAQLALRMNVGQHELDEFLDDKQQMAERALRELRERASELGLAIVGVGVRDVILPGDMKDLMNKVIEAKKAAEANLISRREETAAMRSQANTAKLLDSCPTLMRLRELEVLEKVAQSSNLQVFLGDKEGLTNRIRGLV